MNIKPGHHIHQTELGPLHVDVKLGTWDLNLLVLEMKRRGLVPTDIVSATIDDEHNVDFGLREPLSDRS